MQLQILAVIFIFFQCVAVITGQGFKPAGQISEHCLHCICEATSDCDENVGCTNDGPGQYYCGPYSISYQYWKDGGSPGENPQDPLDFEKCLNNKPCAEAAIKGYMQRWGTDCDGDGYIDCPDWALLHKAGPNGCNGSWALKTDYWARFKTCYKSED